MSGGTNCWACEYNGCTGGRGGSDEAAGVLPANDGGCKPVAAAKYESVGAAGDEDDGGCVDGWPGIPSVQKYVTNGDADAAAPAMLS